MISAIQIYNSLSACISTAHPLLRTSNVVHHILPACTLLAGEEWTRRATGLLFCLVLVCTSNNDAFVARMWDARMATRRGRSRARITAIHDGTTGGWRLHDRSLTWTDELLKRYDKYHKVTNIHHSLLHRHFGGTRHMSPGGPCVRIGDFHSLTSSHMGGHTRAARLLQRRVRLGRDQHASCPSPSARAMQAGNRCDCIGGARTPAGPGTRGRRVLPQFLHQRYASRRTRSLSSSHHTGSCAPRAQCTVGRDRCGSWHHTGASNRERS